jgi:transposase
VAREVRQEGRSVDDVSGLKPRRHHAQKKSKQATERLRDDVIERKKAFIEEIKTFEFNRLIFLDECGVNTSMTPRYARAMRGQRALSHVPFQRGTNISVVACLTAEGVLAWSAYDGAVDGERFINFLVDKLLPKVRRGDVLVMDNVRFHKTAEVQRVVEEAGVTLCYIPPYHPELNAAEELFSLFKSGLRRREARTLVTLIEEARDLLAGVSPRAAGFVRHVLKLANQPS